MKRLRSSRYWYSMLPSKDSEPTVSDSRVDRDEDAETDSEPDERHRLLHQSRKTYWGSLGWNLAAALLPALYSTLSKLWVANIDSSHVVTTDVYTYISTVAEVLNEGLPRTAWLIIGDEDNRSLRSRLSLSYTLVVFQTLMGLIMSIVFVAAAESFAASFVPREVRQSSLNYVRVSAPVALSSAIQVAVSSCTRALDKPDVPFVISLIGVVCNIVLDFLIISKFHVGSFKPTILMQAGIRLACDMTSALVGLGYFIYLVTRIERQHEESEEQVRPNIKAWIVLARPAVYTFTESLIRNVFYLWVVSTIIGLGQEYATAWGVFNTIRWGLIMVPVQALQNSTLTFIGHRWGHWRKQKEASDRKPAATWKDIKTIIRPAIVSTLLSVGIEVPLCLFLSFWGMKEFAFYLSNSDEVAQITRTMWRNIDWCYIFYAIDYQLAAILLATVPRWYLYQSLGSNFLWMLPWAIVVTVVRMSQTEAWKFYSIIFGGSLVFSCLNVALVLGLWIMRLMQGKIRLPPVVARSS
ncbi:hypothetical protein BU16DRAFT_211451 [Lophium mytilinum]|uniref:MATE efflux family protein n=1 Tax=Lophium mytilinum TaxID=390894 RepID=A0A6A6RBZ5_9PEZI|nr:hypothetical protein BU16DRAFT_211451 [Lophium mytilinum]